MSKYLLPKETRNFFDTLCIYQAEDGAKCELSIAQQMKLSPFSTIINQRPKYSMW